MEKLKKLESRLRDIYIELSDAEDPLDMTVLSKEKVKRYEKEAIELRANIDDIYKEKLEQLESENPDILQNDEIRKLYNKSNKENYIILSFLIMHPKIYASPFMLKEFEKFIYQCPEPWFPRQTDDVKKRIDKLNELQPSFFHYENLVAILNDYIFDYLHRYFENKVIMKNSKFIDYLLKKMQNLQYEERHYVTPIMEEALKKGLDFDLVYALGNEKRYEEYLNSHSKEFLINLINTIEIEELKKELLIDIFGIKDITKLHILIKFLKYSEIREQLLDEDSFYYNILIKPLTRENHNYSENEDSLDNEDLLDQESCCEVFCDEEYASMSDVTLFNIDDFDYEFDKMIHHFDNYVNNYIYFFYENEVRKVPVLYYIQTMKRKIDLWLKLRDFVDSIECCDKCYDEIIDTFNNKLSDYIDKSFSELAMEALEENIDKCLSPNEEVYWNDILEKAKAMPIEKIMQKLLEL